MVEEKIMSDFVSYQKLTFRNQMSLNPNDSKCAELYGIEQKTCIF